MPLVALLVQAARVLGIALIHARSQVMTEWRRFIEQRLFDIPVTLFCADGELEVLASNGVPVLFAKDVRGDFWTRGELGKQ